MRPLQNACLFVSLKSQAMTQLQVRVMPNTPCLIGQCASAFVTGNNANSDDFDKTYSLMSAVGEALCAERFAHCHGWP